MRTACPGTSKLAASVGAVDEAGRWLFGEFLTVARAGGQARRMPSPEAPVEKKKLPIAKMAMAGGVALALGAIAVAWVGWQTALAEATAVLHAAMTLVSSAGPGVYFTAMAVLPIF